MLGNLVGSISKTTFYISKNLFLSANGSFVCAKGSSILHRSSSLSKFCGMIFSLDKTPKQGCYLKREHIWLLPCMASFTKVLNCHSRVLPYMGGNMLLGWTKNVSQCHLFMYFLISLIPPYVSWTQSGWYWQFYIYDGLNYYIFKLMRIRLYKYFKEYVFLILIIF